MLQVLILKTEAFKTKDLILILRPTASKTRKDKSRTKDERITLGKRTMIMQKKKRREKREVTENEEKEQQGRGGGKREADRERERETPPSRQLAGGKQAWA